MRKLILAGLILLTGCATPSALTHEGHKISVATAITASEVANYEDLGPLSCTPDFAVYDGGEDCRTRMRNSAALLGAELIVIESESLHVRCPLNEQNHDCIEVHARAYRKLTKSTTTL